MRKSLICLLLIIAALLCAGCAGNEPEASSKNPNKKPSSSSSSGNNNTNPIVEQLIASIGTEGVTVEIGEIETGRYNDSAPVTAQVPDYTELFRSAIGAEDPTEALARAIDKKDFSTVECTGYVTVLYDGDTPIYETEELVKGFVEQELIKAINTILESEEGA